MLKEREPFLHSRKVTENGSAQVRYRLSLLEFVEKKQDVHDERVDLKVMHAQIVDALIDDLSVIRHSQRWLWQRIHLILHCKNLGKPTALNACFFKCSNQVKLPT